MIPQIHIDAETLDTKRSAKLLSLGAVFEDQDFYVEVDHTLYGDAFTTSEGTLDFWARQGGFKVTQRLLPPGEAIRQLHQWIVGIRDSLPGKAELQVWANSPRFDLNILEYHYDKLMPYQLPWDFWEEQDVRTITALSKFLKLPCQKAKPPHHALEDARNQRDFVWSVYSTLANSQQLANERMQDVAGNFDTPPTDE